MAIMFTKMYGLHVTVGEEQLATGLNCLTTNVIANYLCYS